MFSVVFGMNKWFDSGFEDIQKKASYTYEKVHSKKNDILSKSIALWPFAGYGRSKKRSGKERKGRVLRLLRGSARKKVRPHFSFCFLYRVAQRRGGGGYWGNIPWSLGGRLFFWEF